MVQSHKLKLEFFFLNLKQGPLKQILQRQEQRFLNIMTIWLLSPYSPIFLTKTTARKVSKYEVFSGSYFSTFGPEKTLYLDDFYAVNTF